MVAAFGMAMAPAPAVSADAGATPPPKVSTFAPAEDLVRQADHYIEAMKNTVDTEAKYDDSEGKIGRDSNTLIVIALALGLHDQESKYQARAGALMKAAQDVAATKDYASAKKAVGALEKVAAGDGPPGTALKWEKVASLPELMKQVPMVDTKLKFCVKGANFKRKAEESAGYSAAIAAIAQGSIADASATKNADKSSYGRSFRGHARPCRRPERRHPQRRPARRRSGHDEAQPKLRRLPRRVQTEGGGRRQRKMTSE